MIQNYIEMHAPKNSPQLYKLSLKYESGHVNNRGVVLDSLEHRVTCNNEFNSLPSWEFEIRVMKIIFIRGGSREYGSGNQHG